MENTKVIKGICKKTGKRFAMEVKKKLLKWEVVNFIDITEEQAKTFKSEVQVSSIKTAESLLPCSGCGSREVFSCSCAEKEKQCVGYDSKYNFQCVYCKQAVLEYTPQKEIWLAIDVSGSMSGTPLSEAKKAAINMINQTDLSLTKFAVVAFNSGCRIILSPTDNKQQLISAVNSLSSGGGTNEPLSKIYKNLNQNPAQKFIVLLTDGQWSGVIQAVAYAKKAKREGIEIFAIGLGGVNHGFLKSIATSDDFAILTTVSKLTEVFSDIAQQITDSSLNIKLPR